MENLREIVVGIISTGYWPPHLGLNTDAERIEWLARQIEKMLNFEV